ncbi:MAG: hypothetical protein M9894_02110 [Planctomycetes bacterium]|nr:hypothetical protein [Planctomycetota bacterium]
MVPPANDDAERRVRPPTWRDALVAVVCAALVTIVALPACRAASAQVALDLLSPGPHLVPPGLRLAAGLAAPVALLALARRLRRTDDALSPAERHAAHAAAVLWAALAGTLVSRPNAELVVLAAGGLASVALGPLTLARTRPRGLWLGALAALRAAGYTAAGGLAVLLGLVLLPTALFELTPSRAARGWHQAWFDLVVPTVAVGLAAVSIFVAAGDVDERPP